MTVKTYRKKPVVIEAMQYSGSNAYDIYDWMKGHMAVTDHHTYIIIETLEGDMRANPGDYIIKGVRNEFYPCKSDIFEETYEEVN